MQDVAHHEDVQHHLCAAHEVHRADQDHECRQAVDRADQIGRARGAPPPATGTAIAAMRRSGTSPFGHGPCADATRTADATNDTPLTATPAAGDQNAIGTPMTGPTKVIVCRMLLKRRVGVGETSLAGEVRERDGETGPCRDTDDIRHEHDRQHEQWCAPDADERGEREHHHGPDEVDADEDRAHVGSIEDGSGADAEEGARTEPREHEEAQEQAEVRLVRERSDQGDPEDAVARARQHLGRIELAHS